MSQLALPLTLPDHAVFASFLAVGNEALAAALVAIANGDGAHGAWVWGARATGKTHLLQAVCDVAGDRAAYVPLRALLESGPDVLDGLANRAVVCIDDIDRMAGNADWEAALFELCNQIFDANGQLVVAGRIAPRERRIGLPDLASRLARLPVFKLQALNDEQRVQALQLRSSQRGLTLRDDAARFVVTRSRQDMASLYELLDRLDLAALRAKRRLTIPFIREVLMVQQGRIDRPLGTAD